VEQGVEQGGEQEGGEQGGEEGGNDDKLMAEIIKQVEASLKGKKGSKKEKDGDDEMNMGDFYDGDMGDFYDGDMGAGDDDDDYSFGDENEDSDSGVEDEAEPANPANPANPTPAPADKAPDTPAAADEASEPEEDPFTHMINKNMAKHQKYAKKIHQFGEDIKKKNGKSTKKTKTIWRIFTTRKTKA